MNAAQNAVEQDTDRQQTARFDNGVLALFQPNYMMPEGLESAAVSTPCRIAGITFTETEVRYDIDVLVTEPSEVASFRLNGIPSLMLRPAVELAGKAELPGAEPAAPASEMCLQLELSDGSVWNVPVSIIAHSRATYYAKIGFNGDVERSLAEDTLPLFKDDKSEIRDWAENNMNWSEVQAHACQVADSALDMQDEWCNCEKKLVFAPVRA